MRGEPHHAIAVIGDGALTGGMAYEALNNAGHMHAAAHRRPQRQRDVDLPIGRRAQRVSDRGYGPARYIRGQGDGSSSLLRSAAAGRSPGRVGQARQGQLQGVRLRHDADLGGARLHLSRPDRRPRHRPDDRGLQSRQEDRAAALHPRASPRRAKASSPPRTTRSSSTTCRRPVKPGVPLPKKSPAYQDVFGACLSRLANADHAIVGITAAMPVGTGLTTFQKAHPDRFFDVGIAEQHAVTFAAGLARRGLQAGRRDLLDLLTARLRPDHPRCRHSEAAGRLRDRPRRAGRRGWAHPPWRAGYRLSAPHPEHDADGAEGRGRVVRHAGHRAVARGAVGAALPARLRPRRRAAGKSDDPARSARPRCCATGDDVAILAVGPWSADRPGRGRATRRRRRGGHGRQRPLYQAAR